MRRQEQPPVQGVWSPCSAMQAMNQSGQPRKSRKRGPMQPAPLTSGGLALEEITCRGVGPTPTVFLLDQASLPVKSISLSRLTRVRCEGLKQHQFGDTYGKLLWEYDGVHTSRKHSRAAFLPAFLRLIKYVPGYPIKCFCSIKGKMYNKQRIFKIQIFFDFQ